MTTRDQPTDSGGGTDEPTGAYAQFKNHELKSWAVRLAVVATIVVAALWIVAAIMGLLDSDAANGLANLTAIWLLTVGGIALLLGVFLQLASLRVAKLRDVEMQLEAVPDVSGIAKALGDVLKSAKVPVAAMLLGAILMISGGVIAIESLDTGSVERVEEAAERDRDREVAGFDRLIRELCRRLEATDLQPRRLGELGDLLLDLCG